MNLLHRSRRRRMRSVPLRRLCSACALSALMMAAALPAALVPVPAAAAQAQHEGVAFDTVARVGDAALQLNGMGLRGVAWIRAFVAGLYVPQPSRDAQRLLADPGPKRLTLKILLDAPASELGKAVRRGVRKNVAEPQLAGMAERLERLAGRIDQLGRVRPGDTLDLDYQPGRGMVLRVNGEARGAPIAGADLYRAVLAIFIGERPVDATMKQGLLAGGVAGAGTRTGPAADPAEQADPPPAAGPGGSAAPTGMDRPAGAVGWAASATTPASASTPAPEGPGSSPAP